MKIRGLVLAFASFVSLVCSSAFAAAPLASWANASINANGNSQFVETFAAQSGDLYVNFILTPLTGTISYNDFLVLWLDASAGGDHTKVANIGMKADVVAQGDFMVRDSLANNYLGSFVSDQAQIGQTVSLWGHLYKSAGSTTYNRFDLWSNPAASTWDAVLGLAPEATNTLDTGLVYVTTAGFRSATLSSGDTLRIDSAAIYNAVSAIPEPGTYAMILAGLGLITSIARRRNRA